MLNIAVCDDSRTDVEMLESAFDKLAQYQFSYEVYFTAKELLKHVIDDGEMYHLYIFDIEMPEMNGLQLAKEIRKIDAKALFVFLTGYTQYVMDVFEVITFDYISKPITVEKLESVLLKAMQYLHMIKRDFVFQFRKNQFRISCDDIVYFEKKGRQAVIHTISENFKANMTTEEIWKQLDDKVFAHIHVSYIINLGHIRAIEGDEVVMDNEERLLIARSHKQNLKEKHGNLVDNAVEACSKVPEGQRFVKIENKYQSGILLLVITNSKTGKKNKSLKTTKKDNIRHGHGVQSVRKVVEKYNGTVSFTDKGDIFEVSAMLYGIEVKE